MTKEQAIQAVQNVTTYDMGTCDSFLAAGKLYAKWCYENNVFRRGKYGILHISTTDINPQEYIKRFIFVNESSLIEEISSIVPIYGGYIGVVACLFAWLGISNPADLLETDVDIENRVIVQNGIVTVNGFSDFIFDFLSKYSNLQESTRENGITDYTVIKDCSVNTFIKQFYSPKSHKFGKRLDMKTVQIAISKLNQKNELFGNAPRITYTNIMKSGSLNRLYNAEKAGIRVTDRVNKEVVEGFFYQYDYRSIRWLYKHYKEAFNL